MRELSLLIKELVKKIINTCKRLKVNSQRNDINQGNNYVRQIKVNGARSFIVKRKRVICIDKSQGIQCT